MHIAQKAYFFTIFSPLQKVFSRKERFIYKIFTIVLYNKYYIVHRARSK